MTPKQSARKQNDAAMYCIFRGKGPTRRRANVGKAEPDGGLLNAALLDQPGTASADPVGKESRQLPWLRAFSVCYCGITNRRGSRIGSKSHFAIS